jgi:hypothetical protein
MLLIFFFLRGPSRAVGGRRGPSGAVKGPSGAVEGRRGPSGTIGGHRGPSGAIKGPSRGRRGPYGAIPWPLGAVRGRRGPSGADGPKFTFHRPVLYRLQITTYFKMEKSFIIQIKYYIFKVNKIEIF